MASELGTAYVQIVPAAEGISGSISSLISPEATAAGKSAGISIAGGIGSALAGATTVVAAGTAAVTGAIIKGSSDLAVYGDNIDKMSQKMGLSAQSYQEWDAVMQHSGTSMEAMKSSMKTLANAAVTNSKAFEELGITQEQLSTMSQEELFAATITALQNVEDTTQRTYLAGKTLGKGATELGALLNTSAEDTQAMKDRVHELGGVMSDEAVKNAAAFQDNLQDLQTAFQGVGRGLIEQLLPGMNGIMDGFTKLIAGEEGASEAISAGFNTLFDSIGSITETAIEKIKEFLPTFIQVITENLPEIINMAAELIITLAEAIVDNLPQLLTTVIPALVEAAIKLVMALGEALVEAAPKLLDAGIQLIESLFDTFQKADFMTQGSDMIGKVLDGITKRLPDLLKSGTEMLTNIVNGLLQQLPSLIETAGKLLSQFLDFFLQNAPTILESGVKLLTNLIQGIVKSLPDIIKAATKVLSQFLQTFAKNLPQILETGVKILMELITGLLNTIPDLIAALPEIIGAIIEAFASVDWLELGINIIDGIIKGIGSALSALVEAAVNAAKAAFEAAKDFLGINSPSKEFMYIGKMTDEGFALGIEKNEKLVNGAISDLSESATAQLQTASANYDFQTPRAEYDERMDVLLDLLDQYLPEIASNKGLTPRELFNGINRQLGVAIS